MTPARTAASDILRNAFTKKAFASELLDDYLQNSPLAANERRLCTALVNGVIRRRATLDAVTIPFLNRDPRSVEPVVRDILRLGAYQLLFLDAIPPHAAVNETVGLAAYAGVPMARGLVNGVLRRVSELVTEGFAEGPGPDAVPLDQPVPKYRKLAQPVLADPARDKAGYLTSACSWPRWLADRWLARFGFDECLRLGCWFNSPPPLWLRANALKGGREHYAAQLTAAAIPFELGEQPQSLMLPDGGRVPDLPGFAAGAFAVQDFAAQRAAAALKPEPGMTVLDLCAAPGGKTTHLAELMQNRGRIVACDVDPRRLDTVMDLAKRLGITIIQPVLLDPNGPAPAGPFDAAIVDVPCSNTGVLGRRPEVRWRLAPNEFESLQKLQSRLLLSAIARVKPGGHILYSTCSVEPDENTGAVQAARRAVPNLRLEAAHGSVPGAPADGGYWARLRKAV